MSTIRLERLENPNTSNGGIDINSSGNVGIGTSSPNAILELENQGDTKAIINARTDAANGSIATLELWSKNSGGTNNFGFISYDGDDKMEIGTGGSGDGSIDIAFAGANGEAMRIDSSGRLLVGTTTTALNATLQVNGTIAWADDNNSNYTQPTLSIANGATTTFNVVLPQVGASAFQITLAASANGGDKIGGVTAILYGYNDGTTRRRNLQTLNSSQWSFSSTSISGATVTITVTNSSGYGGHGGGVSIIRLR